MKKLFLHKRRVGETLYEVLSPPGSNPYDKTPVSAAEKLSTSIFEECKERHEQDGDVSAKGGANSSVDVVRMLCCSIKAKDAQRTLKLLGRLLPLPKRLQHVKRIRRARREFSSSSLPTLQILLCPASERAQFAVPDEVWSHLETCVVPVAGGGEEGGAGSGGGINAGAGSESSDSSSQKQPHGKGVPTATVRVPAYAPNSRDLAVALSRAWWPVNFHRKQFHGKEKNAKGGEELGVKFTSAAIAAGAALPLASDIGDQVKFWVDHMLEAVGRDVGMRHGACLVVKPGVGAPRAASGVAGKAGAGRSEGTDPGAPPPHFGTAIAVVGGTENDSLVCRLAASGIGAGCHPLRHAAMVGIEAVARRSAQDFADQRETAMRVRNEHTRRAYGGASERDRGSSEYAAGKELSGAGAVAAATGAAAAAAAAAAAGATGQTQGQSLSKGDVGIQRDKCKRRDAVAVPGQTKALDVDKEAEPARKRRKRDGAQNAISSQPPRSLPYLLTGMDVYLTHEPCAMCAMALLHSRCARLFYLEPVRDIGAIESNFAGIHCCQVLNHHYRAFRFESEVM